LSVLQSRNLAERATVYKMFLIKSSGTPRYGILYPPPTHGPVILQEARA
jgi:hypothetical protein